MKKIERCQKIEKWIELTVLDITADEGKQLYSISQSENSVIVYSKPHSYGEPVRNFLEKNHGKMTVCKNWNPPLNYSYLKCKGKTCSGSYRYKPSVPLNTIASDFKVTVEERNPPCHCTIPGFIAKVPISLRCSEPSSSAIANVSNVSQCLTDLVSKADQSIEVTNHPSIHADSDTVSCTSYSEPITVYSQDATDLISSFESLSCQVNDQVELFSSVSESSKKSKFTALYKYSFFARLNLDGFEKYFVIEAGSTKLRDKELKNFYDAFAIEFCKSVLAPAISIKSTNYSDSAMTIYFYCNVRICNKKYRVSIPYQLLDESITLEIFTNLKEKCRHEEFSKRPLAGEARLNIGKKAMTVATEDVLNDYNMKHSDVSMVQNVSYQQQIQRHTIARAKYDLVNKNKKGSDLDELTALAYSLQDSTTMQIEVASFPFVVKIVHLDLVERVKNYALKVKKPIRCHFDSTGGILSKPDENSKPVLIYSLVMPVKTHENNSSDEVVSVAEMYTSRQRTYEVEGFLRFFLFKTKKILKGKFLWTVLVTDWSWPQINAFLKVQGLTTIMYLDIAFEAMQKNSEFPPDNVTPVAACSAHLSKNVSKDVKALVPTEQQKSVGNLVVELFLAIMNLSTFKDLQTYLQSFMALLAIPTENKTYRHHMEVVTTLGFKKDHIMCEQQLNCSVDDITEDMNKKPMYEQSKFYQYCKELYETASKSPGKPAKTENLLCNPRLAKMFLQKYIPYLPFIAGPFQMIEKFEGKRASNALIEEHHKNMKSLLRTYNRGKLGKNRCVDFLRSTIPRIEGLIHRIDTQHVSGSFNPRNKNLPKNENMVENIQLDDDPSDIEEDWKGVHMRDRANRRYRDSIKDNSTKERTLQCQKEIQREQKSAAYKSKFFERRQQTRNILLDKNLSGNSLTKTKVIRKI